MHFLVFCIPELKIPQPITVPKMHWADASDGIILMKNLKAKGLTMLDMVNGKGRLILLKNFALDSL